MMQYRYQIGASALALVLLLTVFVWNSDTPNTDENMVAQQVTNGAGDNSNEVASGGVNRIQLAPPVATTVAANPVVSQEIELDAVGEQAETGLETALTPAVAGAVTTQPDTPASTVAIKPIATPANEPSSPTESAIESVVNADAVPPAPVVKPAVAPVVADAIKKPEPGLSNLSGFEQELLGYAANSYTIQILGSHSEANVQKFVAGKSVTGKHGYYETRHQNKPWFVVVAGNYTDRSAANAVIAQLPAELRNMQPWIRTVGDIQRDIRQLRN